MNTPSLLTLADAARVTGLSGSTLRRYIREGRLKVEPRENNQSPYWISVDEILAAGLTLVQDVVLGREQPGVDPQALRRLRAEYDALQAKLAEVVAENANLRERAARAEGELYATNRLIEKISPSRTSTSDESH